MKITSQSSNELVLREGSAQGVIVGAVFIAAGVAAWFLLRQNSPVVTWFALGLIALGAGLILFSSSITFTANRATGQILYQKKRLVGGSSATYAITDVFRIETRKQWRVERQPAGDQGGRVANPMLVAQSVVVFKNGQELALDHQKSSAQMGVGSAVVMGGQGAETAIAAQVAQWLGVPFQEIMPPNMSSGTNIVIS